MTQYGFFFDQSRCYNCHACVVACRDWNDIDAGAVKWLRMLQWEKGSFPTLRMHVLFATCYHCEKPACVDACSNNALIKEDTYGAVLLDSSRCEGERDCWEACPYGAIQYESDEPGTPASKCDMCLDRLEQGEQPVCVMSCPARALDFGPLEDMQERYGTLTQLEDMPDGSVVEPAIVFKPMSERKAHVPYDVDRALSLLQKREGLPDQFASVEEVANLPEGLIGYERLILKPTTTREALALSKNEEG